MSVLDGSSPEIQAVDQGDGFAIFANSNTRTGNQGIAVLGVRGGAIANPSPVHFGGVVGLLSDEAAGGVLGTRDPVFNQLAGVYGQSAQQGVMGLSTTAGGTGVYGGNTSSNASAGIGVRGETMHGVGVQGQTFGTGLAGKFVGDVEIVGSLRAGGTDIAAVSALRTQVAQAQARLLVAETNIGNAINLIHTLQNRLSALGG